jgi:hypothetical protein
MRRLASAVAVGLFVVAAMGPGIAHGQGRVEYRNHFVTTISETERSCSGDAVELTGTLRHDVIIVVDTAGGLHSSYNIRAVIRGTSEDGTPYVGIIVNNGAEYFSADEAPANGTFGDRFRLISQDDSANLLAHAMFHITIDAQGRVTRFRSELDIVCR